MAPAWRVECDIGVIIEAANNTDQVYYDFSKFGWKDSTFMLHPEHFFVSFAPGKKGDIDSYLSV